MDKPNAKLLLEAFREQDADDPLFAEALHEVEQDSELAAWFAEAQRFDALMRDKLGDVPVPAHLKGELLAGLRAHSPVPSRSRWILPLTAAAAVLIASFAVWSSFAPRRPAEALAMQAIAFTGELPALQFVCFNAAEVANWVNRQPAAQLVGLRLETPPETFTMRMIGSSIVDWNGRPVVMICLQNGQQMAMLYILNGSDIGLGEGESETFEKRDWTARASNVHGQIRILTTRRQAEPSGFLMPL